MILRSATPADAEALAELGRSSFCAKFAHLYTPQDLQAFLDEAYASEVVAAEIADSGITHCLAENADGSGLAAYLKVKHPSPFAEYSDANRPLCLSQLYTDPARTGEGLGAMLMDWCLAFARGRGHDAIQLSVYADNPGAQRFYQRYGFAKIADIFFMVGEHRDDEFLYELRL